MITETDLAWAAGIIDGEGCILLGRWKARNRPGSTYRLSVLVTNTSFMMLHRLREIFGVGFITPRRAALKHHKPQWSWHVSCSEAELVLRAVEPYIVAKRDETRLGILSRQYILGRNTAAKRGGNPHGEKLEWLKRQLSSLKHNPDPTDSAKLALPDVGLPLFEKREA